MNLDKQVKSLIADRVAKLRAHLGRMHLLSNPHYPEQQRVADIKQINEKLSTLKAIHSDLVPRIKKFKTLMPDITEQTPLCAIYLVYGKVMQTWESIFLLASHGHNFDMIELVRSIFENLDLIHTFHLDQGGENLKKWFAGEIIKHGVSRKVGADFLEKAKIKAIEENNLSPEKMAVDVYRGLSKYTHCSYGALLDSVDVFNEDFDWKGYGGAHYTLRNIRTLETFMTSTLVALKMTYRSLNDTTSFEEINKILADFAGPMDEAALLEDLKSKPGKLTQLKTSCYPASSSESSLISDTAS